MLPCKHTHSYKSYVASVVLATHLLQKTAYGLHLYYITQDDLNTYLLLKLRFLGFVFFRISFLLLFSSFGSATASDCNAQDRCDETHKLLIWRRLCKQDASMSHGVTMTAIYIEYLYMYDESTHWGKNAIQGSKVRVGRWPQETVWVDIAISRYRPHMLSRLKERNNHTHTEKVELN